MISDSPFGCFSRRRGQVIFGISVLLLLLFYPFRSSIVPSVVPQSSPPIARALSARTLLSRPLSRDVTAIPKIIHQTWFPAGSNMSERAQVWVHGMRAQNPDWEYVLWDDQTNRMLVEQHFPWFLQAYDRLPKEILRADVVRNLYMYLFGGMYADVDTEALRPVAPLFAGHETALAAHQDTLRGRSSQKSNVARAFLGRMARTVDILSSAAVPNGWMASPPGHPFWLLPVLNVIEHPEGTGDGSVEGLTGPGALSLMIKKSWVFWSNLTVLFNKWILDATEFTILLTAWHLIFATVVTQIMARTTTMLDGRKNIEMNSRMYARTMVPIGLLYSGSLVCSNIVYLYLNISFIQILKAAGPVVTLFVSWSWGVATPSLGVLINVLIITCSVGLAVSGEIQFSMLGIFFQMASLVCDANRLVMIQILLSDDGQKMDPLVSLYYTAPVCAVLNSIIAWQTELQSFHWSTIPNTGYLTLLANAVAGFMLNVSIFVLIGKTSGLTTTLVSIPKNILLIVASVVLWHTQINMVQIVGYSIALLALLYYSLGWKTIKCGMENVHAWRKDPARINTYSDRV
ncbi:triose-phosphate transporter family-domain-containing protein [Aspergillus coremiiformis]|uniref:Triose-phosphate transporter family-domain-containing protein n=1 Tax=Aspergillus coremiiformis TaxID=138285 RepID=A0A5N6ZE39_9EURO|nr:triose-phosphate transporter family-domain-containing protein [Aspergillus coremiiformis]